MLVERVAPDKLKALLTDDDLLNRGLDKDNIWTDLAKMQELFNDMMEQAKREFDFDISGLMSVEIFFLPSKGVLFLITRLQEDLAEDNAQDPIQYLPKENDKDNGSCCLLKDKLDRYCPITKDCSRAIDQLSEYNDIETKQSVSLMKEILFKFADLEDIIAAVNYAPELIDYGGQLIFYKDDYYLIFSEQSFTTAERDFVYAILTEFGETSNSSPTFLREYGKVIMIDDAAGKITEVFGHNIW